SSACVLRFRLCSVLFCVNSTPPSRPYILSLHDALPILDTALTVHSVPQMIAGSEFITRMHEGGSPYVPGIEYTNISTRHDEFVRPYTSGQLEGGPEHTVTNIVVQDGCTSDYSDHLAICGSRRAATIVLNALDDEDQHRVRCEVVPPLFG